VTVTHSTFVIERTYDVPVERVWAACADPAVKAQWFGPPEEWGPRDYSLDFRVGGHEISRGGPAGGPVHTYDAVIRDFVPNERIVTTYEMHLDDVRISVSLATIEMSADGEGTRFVLTEQGAYLDGHDYPEQREHGTGELLEALGTFLAKQRANEG
jgi:uncharacterized protein YndB with AHSA1/START domain